MPETAQPKGAYIYSSAQPCPVQVIQLSNPSANQRPTFIRFLYAFALAALVWFLGATLLWSMVHWHFAPWVSSLRFGPSFVLMIS